MMNDDFLNEFADFIEGFHDFISFAKQLRGKNDEKILKLKLQIVTMIAIGVSHIHEIDGPNNATMVHYDINPKNIAVTNGGIPKLNDFNVAQFLRWNIKTATTCGFHGRLHEPWWRAPEEMNMSDVIRDGHGAISLPVGQRLLVLNGMYQLCVIDAMY